LNRTIIRSQGMVIVELLQVLSTSNTTTLALLSLGVKMGILSVRRLDRLGLVGLVHGGSMGTGGGWSR
jgi:hypothetical protein